MVMNLLNLAVFVILSVVPLVPGAEPGPVEAGVRWLCWGWVLLAPFLTACSAGLIVYALAAGLPSEEGGEALAAWAGLSFLAALPMLFLSIKAWLGSFSLVR